MVNLLEKYRPRTLKDIVGQDFIVTKLEAYIKDIKEGLGDGDFPHFMFSGPPGTGKTTAAHCVLNDAFGKDYRTNLLEKNASNVLIKDLREEILDFASKSPIGHFKGSDGNLYDIPFNIIFLDEVDRLSKDSQQILRRTMETCAVDTRFILACNYPNNVIDAIRSRCTRFYFKKLDPEALTKMLRRIIKGQGWEVTEEALDLVSKHVGGDARRAVSTVELGAKTGKVDENEIKKCLPIVLEKFNTKLLTLAYIASTKSDSDYIKDFNMIDGQLEKLHYGEGKSAQQILISIFESTESDKEMPADLKRKIYETISECNRDIHLVEDPIFAIKCWLRSLKL